PPGRASVSTMMPLIDGALFSTTMRGGQRYRGCCVGSRRLSPVRVTDRASEAGEAVDHIVVVVEVVEIDPAAAIEPRARATMRNTSGTQLINAACDVSRVPRAARRGSAARHVAHDVRRAWSCAA